MITSITTDLKNNIGVVCLASMLGASSLLNVHLGLKLRQSPQRASAPLSIVGSKLTSIPVIDADGARHAISIPIGIPAVVYMASPKCVWCARNLDNIRSLAKSAGAEYQFIGISNTAIGLAEYVASTPMPFSIQAVDMDHLPKGLDPRATPQIAVVGRDGTIEKVWSGALAAKSKNKAEVEAFFHTNLPGTVEAGRTVLK